MFIPPGCIRIVSFRNDGLSVRYDFVVDDSDLGEVAAALVAALDQGATLFVNDHRRTDSDGGLSLSKGVGCVQRMVGGHGYSSDWSEISSAEAVAEVTATLAATRGGPRFAGGHFGARR